ncbi:hypothetical protein LY01_01177 [Nonlabens xylanidelens]|uniref:Uncharacterized protein n=1 Tax=Nonlabens xylanidelens TaxID=191564 RepID=A0A2S6IN51_9FLAO|nr:hypothetical protein [Nonlabens xylanidelens]PPK95586.1 hypothetical protein LY01_01177 [Nonlabens xylanidelens]PQJ22391.1 hypothetical protein BST94_02130 [Nonlabens xylanidelens]
MPFLGQQGFGILLDRFIEFSSVRGLVGGSLLFFCAVTLWIFENELLIHILLILGIILGISLILWKVLEKSKDKDLS